MTSVYGTGHSRANAEAYSVWNVVLAFGLVNTLMVTSTPFAATFI